MPIRHYDEKLRRYRKLPIVRVLFAANMLFAVATLIAWQAALMNFFGPLAWATSHTMPDGREWPLVLNYPLVLFWSGPALAMVIAWLYMQDRNYRAAFGVLSVPLLVLGLSLAMFYLQPPGT